VIIEPGITKSAIFAKNDMPEVSGPYAPHYRRMLQMYATGIPVATDPFEVAAIIYDAVTTDKPQLRYPCSWGGPEMIAGRDAIGEDGWVDIGRATDDTDYYRRFQEAFGVDIAPRS
jgi:hypothetical protein